MMKKFFVLACSLVGFTVFAQKTHTVEPKENPYSISKKYGIAIDDLYQMNPQIKNGKLSIGDVLVIQKKTTAAPKNKLATTTLASAKTTRIVLQPKQTIYGITKQYHINEADLRSLNPDLEHHLKIGDEVVLPADVVKKYADKNAFNKTFNVVADVSKEASIAEPATITPENIKTEDGVYVVQAKDNYYRITKTFSVSQKELFAWNPGLEEKGLQPGDKIIVKNNTKPASPEIITNEQEEKPSKKETITPVLPAEEYQMYTVQEGDTVFGIVNKYDTSLEVLLALNPKLTEGLKPGMVIKVKRLDASYTKKSGDELNVLLMLPFGFEDGESKYRAMAGDFLTGAKLAIERSAKGGQKLDIKVVDSGSESSFRKSLTQINPNNTDLIIGPFFKSNVLEVLEYVKANKIPVVAPFANSEDLRKFNNVVIVEADQDVFADRIVKEVISAYSDQKIYIVADADKTYATYIKKNLEGQLKNPNVVVVNSATEIQLDTNMMTGQTAPVIAILASDQDDLGAAFSSKVAQISAETTGVKAFSMYYHPSFEKNLDALGKASLVYLMDRKINNEGVFEKEILATYKKKYCKAPSKYAVIGFDVVNDILSRENGKGELFRQMGKVQTQLATKFEFVKSKEGAYVNQGYRVVRLVP